MSLNMQDTGRFPKGRLRWLGFLLILVGCVIVWLTSYTDPMVYSKTFGNITLGHVYTNLAQSLEFPRRDFFKGDGYWPGSIWPYVLSTISWQENASRASADRKNLRIVYWTSQYTFLDWTPGAGHEPFVRDNCPVHQCEFTSDPTAFNSSDYILIHQSGLRKSLPEVKLPGQKWIFKSVESPVYSSRVQWTNYNGFFEVVVDRSLFADISVFQAYFRGHPTAVTDRLVNYAQRKNRDNDSHVAWFVSHCETQSKREKYVRELQKHIHVDVYGRCGPKKCPRNLKSRSPDKDPCMNMLNKEYKFYLAFENSLCEDYVTEKAWSVFLEGINIVPVVLGGAVYSRIFPPNSFIDVLDFDSPQHLAQYLFLLNENDTLYNEYFTWRDRYSVEPSHVMTCWLCSYLHSHANISQEVHRDLDQMKSPQKHCVSPKEYYGNRLKI